MPHSGTGRRWRLCGIRCEELLELSQLSIRQYVRPNGEVVALLVVAPSKTDRERVIPMTADTVGPMAPTRFIRATDEAHPIPPEQPIRTESG